MVGSSLLFHCIVQTEGLNVSLSFLIKTNSISLQSNPKVKYQYQKLNVFVTVMCNKNIWYIVCGVGFLNAFLNVFL